jgi:hypothetical protein
MSPEMLDSAPGWGELPALRKKRAKIKGSGRYVEREEPEKNREEPEMNREDIVTFLTIRGIRARASSY